MFAYLKGHIEECSPTNVVLDVNGVGYNLSISLYTFERIAKLKEVQLFTHLWIKEDAHSLFGFFDKEEKAIFELMITVSGIGPSIARTMLSTLSPSEVIAAISSGNVPLLQSVKGIGAKTAQRMVLELQDKVLKNGGNQLAMLPTKDQNREEALSALVMLGFARNAAEKALAAAIKANPGQDFTVEQLIKLTLKAI